MTTSINNPSRGYSDLLLPPTISNNNSYVTTNVPNSNTIGGLYVPPDSRIDNSTPTANNSSSVVSYNPQPTGYNPQATANNAQPTGYNLQPTSYNPQPTSYNPQSTSYSPQPTGYNSQATANNAQPTGHNSQEIANNAQPTGYNLQPTSYNPQPTSYNPQSTSYNPQPTAINSPSNNTNIYQQKNQNNNPRSPYDILIDSIEDKIYGQEVDISPSDINQLFEYPITSELNVVLYEALKRSAINPDTTLLQILPKAISQEYIIPISLCLRFGADANMYLDSPKLGTIHILGYTYYLLYDNAPSFILNTIVLMFIITNSRPTMPIFDDNAGRIENKNADIYARYKKQHATSVIEWIHEQRYMTIIDKLEGGVDISNIKKIFDTESIIFISILLDNPKYAVRPYQQKDLKLAIQCFSITVVKTILNNATSYLFEYLDTSVIYYNSDAYISLIDYGESPSYFLMNNILLRMRNARQKGRVLQFRELYNMLLYSISRGSQLDNEQRIIVANTGDDILTGVINEYQTPYWRKICSNGKNYNKNTNDIDVISPSLTSPTSITERNIMINNNNNNNDGGERNTYTGGVVKHGDSSRIPDRLKQLAFSLNLNTSSKTAICNHIDHLSKSNRNTVVAAAQKRQQTRMRTDTSSIDDFMNNEDTNYPICRNQALLEHELYDYNDLDLAYYKDDQGVIWCFPSEMYQNLLLDGKNPYNMTILPEKFKENIRYRLTMLDKQTNIINPRGVGLYNVYKPMTFTEALDNLNEPDKITDKYSQQALDAFFYLGTQYHVYNLKLISKEKLISAFRSIRYHIELKDLSNAHALITSARAIDYIRSTNPTAIALFFESLTI